MNIYLRAVLAFLSLILATNGMADTLLLAVASNFKQPAQRLADLYSAQNQDVDAETASASSGKLYAQTTHGAPHHVFMSADFDKPLALIKSSLADEDSAMVYAIGRLALWQPTATQLNLDNLSALSKPAIANPKHAPYGLAAKDLLADPESPLHDFHYAVTIHENEAEMMKELP